MLFLVLFLVDVASSTLNSLSRYAMPSSLISSSVICAGALMKQCLQHLCIHTLSYLWIVVYRQIKNLSASLSHGCFCFKRLKVVSFRDNMPFSKLFERSFIVLLTLPLFMYSTNFLDSFAIDFGLVESELSLLL